MKKSFILLLFFLCGYAGLQAQSLSQAKSSSNYYGEGTGSGEDAAVKAARAALAVSIKPDMMKDPQFRKADPITCAKIADAAQAVVSKSGSRMTAVAYIPKAELKRIYAEVAMFEELPDDGLDEFGVPTGAIAASTPSKPAIQQGPTTQTAQPAAETPAVSRPQPGSQNQPVAQNQPVTQGPEAVTAQPAQSAKPAQPTTVSPHPTVSTPAAPAGRPVKTGNKILDEIIEATNIVEINDLLTTGKNKGSLAYGRLSTMTAPENSYLLVYKPDGSIVAVYDKGSNTRRNLRTGTSENYASAFDNVKIIWFQLY